MTNPLVSRENGKLDPLDRRLRALLRDSVAPNTRIAYNQALRRLNEWADFGGMPMDDYDLARYIAHLEEHEYSLSTVQQSMAAIAWAHHAGGWPSPTEEVLVRRVMKGFRRRNIRPTKRARPILWTDLVAMLHALPHDAAGGRDRALLLVGWAGCLRASELSAMRWEAIVSTPAGVLVTLPTTKTELDGVTIPIPQATHVDERYCPVRALRNWREWRNEARNDEGPVFISTRGPTFGQRLSEQAINNAVIRRAKVLDGDGFSSHSLRAGFITEAALRGIPEREIQRQSRHRSTVILRQYVRIGTAFTDNAVTRLF